MIVATAIALVIFVGVLIKLPFVNAPLDRDYGIYGHHALFWVEGRKTPYRDTNENHPPGRWLLYAILLKLFPLSRSLFRYSGLFFIVMTNIVVAVLAGLLYDTTTSIAAAFCFTLLISLPIFVWIQSNDEIQQVFFTALAVLLALISGTNFFTLFLIGLVSFGAVLFKQSAYLNTVPVIFIAILMGSAPIALSMSMVLLGLVTGLLITWQFFRYQKIPVDYFINTFGLSLKALRLQLDNILFRRRVKTAALTTDQSMEDQIEKGLNQLDFKAQSDQAQVQWSIKLFRAFFSQTSFFLILAAVAAVSGLFEEKITGSKSLIIWLWLTFSFGTVLLNRHLMPYHFIPVSVSIAILSGLGLSRTVQFSIDYIGTAGGLVLILSLLLLFYLLLRNQIGEWVQRERKGCGQIYTNQAEEWVSYKAGEGVGKYLKTVTTSTDSIYVWGSEYEIYLWSGCPSPTWDLFCPRLKVSFTSDPVQAETYILEQLQADIPKYIVVTASMDENPRFAEFLRVNYKLERKMFGEIEIHLRKELQVEQQVVTQIVQEQLVSIIMLTWNALEYTRQCIDSIRANTHHPHEIIFVDNASTDGTVDYLNELVTENENYRLIANPGNRGFAAGNNQGMVVAQGNYLLLLNNDVLVPKSWLERLVRCAEMESSIGLVGPLTNRISGLQMIENITYSDPADSFEYARRIAQAHQGKYTPRRRLAGFALLISRALYERIGGLDERFGSGNYEDDDYCLRATAAGFKIMVAEDVFVHHFGSVSFESNDIDYNQAIAKNRVLFRDKWPQIDLDWLMERNITLVDLNNQIAERAQVVLEKQQCKKTIRLYQKILKTNPVDYRALFGMGLAYYMQNDNQRALEIFQRITNLIPEFSTVYANIGLIHAQSGDLSQAVTSLNRAVELDPHNLDTQVQLAEVLLLNDQIDLGTHVLKSVLEADPQHIGGLNRMGILMLEINRKEKARCYFEIALQLDPNNEMAERQLTKINEL